MMAENQQSGQTIEELLQVLENICSLLQDKENHSRASPREGDIIQFSCPPYLGFTSYLGIYLNLGIYILI